MEVSTDDVITVEFDVIVGDHVLLMSGSTHWIGVGFLAGPSLVWVDQHELEVNKVIKRKNICKVENM